MQEPNYHNEDLIDKYLNNTLTKDEEVQLKTLVEQDEDLRDKLMQQKRVITAVRAHDRAKLKEQLKGISAQQPEKVSNKPSIILWLSSAAAIFLIISIGYIFHSQNRPISQQFSAYYEVFPTHSIQRGSTKELEDALKLYNEGNFAEAATALEKLKNDQAPDLYHIYLGNSYIQTGELDKAITIFKSLLVHNQDVIVQQHARWYLALTYLKQDNKSMLNQELQKIIDAQGIYADLATKLYSEAN